jgi:HYDIN/CFA65/VesB-like, Ig-like domain/Multicopper oxidase
MTDRTYIHRWGTLLLVPLLLTVLLAGAASGEEYWLRAGVKTIPAGTFGNMSTITMWGYGSCGSNFSGCADASVPGPTLTAHVGTSLIVHVQNDISGKYTEPVSLVVNGQRATEAGANSPVWTDGTSGSRGTNYDLRVRSFTHEAAIGGGTATYVWGAPKQGTYLYESGTHPGVQVQMGLYGPLVVYPAGGAVGGPGTAYGTAYQAESTLVFSEIDPVLHAAISNGDYGPGKAITSPIDYHPKFFLVNGLPYSEASPAVAAGIPGQTVLLRLLNAGLQLKMPTLQDSNHLLANQYMRLIADDGNQLPGSGQRMYSHLLPPGKTLDALLVTQDNGSGGGNIAVYDRMLNLTNGPYSPGGALQFLNVGAVPTLTALPNLLNYGEVPLLRPVQMVVSVKNDGLAPLIFSNVPGISGPDASEFRTVFGMTAIQPGESASLTVLFRPTTPGPKSATLTLATNDPNVPGQLLSIPILGTAY